MALVVGFLAFASTTGVKQRDTLLQLAKRQSQALAKIEQITAATQSNTQATREAVQSGPAAASPSVTIVRTRAKPTPFGTSSPHGNTIVLPLGPESTSGVFVFMDVDKEQAAPGDTLNYSIAVQNRSKDGVRLTVLTHIPVQTRFISSDSCPAGGVSVSSSCPFLFTEGQAGVHQIRYSRSLGPDKTDVFRFAVQIDVNAVVGSRVTNHAHIQGPNVATKTSNEVPTNVGAATPPAKTAGK